MNKVEGIRKQLKKLLDKKTDFKREEELQFDDTKIKGKLKGIDKKCAELKEVLEKQESKLRTSLKSKKKQKQKDEDDEEDGDVNRYKNSDDEEDEFFDRTKFHKFNKNTVNREDIDSGVENYETIKTKLE